jgi:hypothetical protein
MQYQSDNGFSQNAENNAYMQLVQEKQTLQKEVATARAKLLEQQSLLQKLHAIDYDELSPKKALDILWSFKEANV